MTACTSVPPSNVKTNAQLTPSSQVNQDLLRLPLPKEKLIVAVYGMRDQTGQYKPSPDSANSTAVTQGASSMLVKALNDTGWYIPVEREGLQNLLTERKLIRAIESPTEKGKPSIDLPNLLPASLIVEGGLIAFESNVRTGGKGANYLGIGANSQYRIDQVTVSLHLVDSRNGQILGMVNVTKTIYSYQFSASIYKFTGYQQLLQGETGFTTNEPAQLAVKQAIEAAVIHLTLQGVRDRFLVLNDELDIYTPVVQKYLQEDRMNADETQEDNLTPVGFATLANKSHAGVVSPLLTPAIKLMPVKLMMPEIPAIAPQLLKPGETLGNVKTTGMKNFLEEL